MKYRRLGSTGLRVSVIGMGTWQFGGEWGKDFSQDEADRMLGRAKELGINLVDTAECYGDHVSETLIGNYLSTRRDRADWVIATKFGHHFKGLNDRDTVYDPVDVVKQLERTLRALRTDYVDVYQFHSGADEHFETPGLWETLREQKRLGKVRHLGVSISSTRENLNQVEASPKVGAEVIQVLYNRLERGPEQRVLPACRRLDLGVLARVPLASGYLSGKYKPGAKFTATDVRSTQDPKRVDEKLKEVERIAREEVPAGVDMAKWALAWCLRHEAVASVIPGCKDVKQVEANAAAAALVAGEHPLAWREAR
jgi:aryl-alcohol dehydrogenase-like predicted oxidoreductase